MPDRPASLPADPAGDPSRRALLRAAGLAALAGGGAALTACSADADVASAPDVSSPPTDASPSATGTPSATSAAPTAESAAPTRSRTPKASPTVPDGPSVAASEVPVGSGVILDDEDYVVTQPTKGEFKAFSRICTHNRCPVSEVSGEDIVCRCHGSRFSVRDGSVVRGPAKKPLAAAAVTVAGGQVVVTG